MRGGAIIHFASGQLVKTFKIFFRTEWSISSKLCIQHRALRCYQDCSNDDPTFILTFDLFIQKSTLVSYMKLDLR